MKIALALVLLGLVGSTLITAEKSRFLQGDERWLATDKCSFADAEQCASEKAMKDLLRHGPIRVDKID